MGNLPHSRSFHLSLQPSLLCLCVADLVGVRVLPISEIEAMSGRIGWYVLCPSEGEPSNLSLGQVGLHFNISNA